MYICIILGPPKMRTSLVHVLSLPATRTSICSKNTGIPSYVRGFVCRLSSHVKSSQKSFSISSLLIHSNLCLLDCSTLKDERLMFCLGVIGRSLHSLVRSTTPHDYFPLVSVFQNYLTTSVFAHGMFSRNDTARPYVPVFFSLAPVQMSRRRHYVLCPPCPKSNTVASCLD